MFPKFLAIFRVFSPTGNFMWEKKKRLMEETNQRTDIYTKRKKDTEDRED